MIPVSGVYAFSAPAARPPTSGRNPQPRPIVSTTKARLLAEADMRTMSIERTTVLSAVSEPTAIGQPGRLLSMLAGSTASGMLNPG